MRSRWGELVCDGLVIRSMFRRRCPIVSTRMSVNGKYSKRHEYMRLRVAERCTGKTRKWYYIVKKKNYYTYVCVSVLRWTDRNVQKRKRVSGEPTKVRESRGHGRPHLPERRQRVAQFAAAILLQIDLREYQFRPY